MSRPAVAKHLRKFLDAGTIVRTQPARSKLQRYRWLGDPAE
ncbi:MAG: hypothetical protein LBN10_10035 [Propionibacteriaceae bacterium]|nr:hypothetical protein [Propionibacteriaceae bacterium]